MGGTMRLGADPVKLHDGHARARDLRRGRDLRAPPPPLRGEQPPAQAARGRRPRLQRHLARRPPGRGDRAARPPVLRGLAVPPRVQVAARLRPQPLFREFVGAALERARERAPRGRARGAGRDPRVAARSAAPGALTRDARRPAAPPPPSGAARSHDFVRLCEIESPSRQRARGGRRGDGRARGARARGRGGRQRRRDGLRRAATCSPGSAGPPARARSCSAPTSTPCRSPARSRSSTANGVLQQPPRGDPRRRQQGRRGHDPRDRPAPGCAERSAGRRRAALHHLRGAGAARAPRPSTAGSLQSEFGYVFDHASPIGELSPPRRPTTALEADFRGQAAHAGIRPEAGRNAIVAAARARSRPCRSGRLDAETTANVGSIEGGTRRQRRGRALQGRARGPQPRRRARRRGGQRDGRRRSRGGQRTRVRRRDRGRAAVPRLPLAPTAPVVEVAAEALSATAAIEPVYITTGGGSDANALSGRASVLNVANGTEATTSRTSA